MPNHDHHARLVAAGRCVDCSKPRGESPAATRCTVCGGKHRAAQVAYRRKKRLEDPWHDITHGDPFPMGGAAPRIRSVTLLRIRLNRPALDALYVLKAQEVARCRAGGERHIGYQVSRLIREAIQTFATRDFPVPPRMLNTAVAVTFHCDAPTLAIIDYHARRRFDGNRAATVRAMLAAVVTPTETIDPGRAIRPYQGYNAGQALRLAWEDQASGEEPSPLDDPQYHWEKRQQVRRNQAHGEAQRQAIEQEAKEKGKMPRKNFWEYSPVYQQNKAKGERDRREGVE